MKEFKASFSEMDTSVERKYGRRCHGTERGKTVGWPLTGGPDPAPSSNVSTGSYCLNSEIRGLWGHFAPHGLNMGVRTRPVFTLIARCYSFREESLRACACF